MKVLVVEHTQLTTQLYFPDEFIAQLYGEHPAYKDFGLSPYNLKNDAVIGERADGQGLLLRPQPLGAGVVASGKLGIA